MTMNLFIRTAALVSIAAATLPVVAGPKEEALAVADLWSAAYSSNDVDTLVSLYQPNAVLLGTVSPVLSEGTDAIRAYFGRLKGSGNSNRLSQMRFFELGEDAALVTGFYVFSNASRGPDRPSRFTMLVTRKDGAWRIAHHHSSPHVQ
jgi:uncharacterized protein (TIGR02246 family)